MKTLCSQHGPNAFIEGESGCRSRLSKISFRPASTAAQWSTAFADTQVRTTKNPSICSKGHCGVIFIVTPYSSLTRSNEYLGDTFKSPWDASLRFINQTPVSVPRPWPSPLPHLETLPRLKQMHANTHQYGTEPDACHWEQQQQIFSSHVVILPTTTLRSMTVI